MHKRVLYLALTFWLLAGSLAVSAQGAPGQIEAALANLSSQVGKTVTLGDLNNWGWEQSNYPDASLGCPQPNVAYAQVVTPGYRFELTYGSKIYDYRVTIDGATVILCSVSDTNAPTSTPDPSVPVVVTYIPPCPTVEPNTNYLRIRLKLGIQGRVEPGSANNVRAIADKDSALVGEIPGGGIFTVIGGPQCSNGMVWWNVNYDGLIGWTVEGLDGDYWIEPLPPLALPTTRAIISTNNAAQIAEIARITGNLSSELAFSADGKTLGVLGGFGSDGVWLYNMDALGDAPRILESDGTQTTLTFSPTQPTVFVGGLDGWVTLFDPRIRSNQPETLRLKPFASDIASIAFQRDGNFAATAGSVADITKAGVDPQNAIVLVNLQTSALVDSFSAHTAKVTALAYSPDGVFLASGGLDSVVQVWTPDANGQWQARTTLQMTAPVRSLAYSPDGGTLAVGLADGTVSLWTLADNSETPIVGAHANAISAMSFSPDGSLLVTASDDGTAKVWSVLSAPAAGGKDLLMTLQGPFQTVTSVAFSPDGTMIATATNDSTIRLWGISNSLG